MFRFLMIISISGLYLFTQLLNYDTMNLVLQVLCIFVFLMVYKKLNPKRKVLTGSLFFLGILIHFFQGYTGLNLFNGITQNLALLSIIILAPLLSIPLRQEGIIDGVVTMFEKRNDDEQKTFYGTSGFMLSLAPILNMGALRIVHGFLKDINIQPKMLSQAYYSGFTPSIIWSPFFASVGIVLFTMEMSYLNYMPIGMTFAVIQILIGFFILRPRKSDDDIPEQVSLKEDNQNKNLVLLLIFVVSLLILLVLQEAIIDQPMLTLVCMNCMIIPVVWAVIRQKQGRMKEVFLPYKKQVANGINMEIAIFLSAGLFGNALVNTRIVDVVGAILVWSSQISIFLLFLLILLLVTIMALFGMHQIIVVPIILTLLLSTDIQVSAMAIAFMCTFAWMLSSAISPLNALNIIISSCVRKDGWTVAYRWNGKYFFAVTLCAFIYVYIINVI
ncbi:hypothetical protein GWK91_10535 [Virgibacillus sp. MSP4-1]|uniref:hypothetical protein n=1 Tax=Virgibacillus sp. MSP4-1 TaxID=2700081 RepID=UPI0005C5BDF9|nr:hypothetical protein [Virgibacillus sp. MSP4-1]QHS23362.1 hypothetical protein GWK91_10535 [Virgibacillus sp. MSP4-1]